MTTKPTKSPTYHKGANDERTTWLAKLRRERRHWSDKYAAARILLDRLIAWGTSRCPRCKKAKGGL